jgi:hypothetical protein
MNAKLSQGRDGCCAGVPSLCEGSKTRQPSPDLLKNGDTSFSAAPAAAQSGHVDSMQPCRPLTQGGHTDG